MLETHISPPISEFRVDQLHVAIYCDRATMGRAAALTVAEEMKRKILSNGAVAIILAAAPSQDEFLASLALQPNVEWNRVVTYQMDEYIGLESNAPQKFSNYLHEKLFSQVRPGKVHALRGDMTALAHEMKNYASFMAQVPPEITCAGIGENGHLAFNEPDFADFSTSRILEEVELTEASRQQQVNDGCFPAIEEVPRRALTVTIPVLLRSSLIACVVPSKSKAEAVREMLVGPISSQCPASILRQHTNAKVFLDPDSAALITESLGKWIHG